MMESVLAESGDWMREWSWRTMDVESLEMWTCGEKVARLQWWEKWVCLSLPIPACFLYRLILNRCKRWNGELRLVLFQVVRATSPQLPFSIHVSPLYFMFCSYVSTNVTFTLGRGGRVHVISLLKSRKLGSTSLVLKEDSNVSTKPTLSGNRFFYSSAMERNRTRLPPPSIDRSQSTFTLFLIWTSRFYQASKPTKCRTERSWDRETTPCRFTNWYRKSIIHRDLCTWRTYYRPSSISKSVSTYDTNPVVHIVGDPNI